MSQKDRMVEEWHAASDHARDGSPLGGYLCNCARIVDRAVALGWTPQWAGVTVYRGVTSVATSSSLLPGGES